LVKTKGIKKTYSRVLLGHITINQSNVIFFKTGITCPEAQPKGVQATEGVKISISTDRNVNNEFIPGYSQK
jgi:hypothetical protein